jgi:hypothetical protein
MEGRPAGNTWLGTESHENSGFGNVLAKCYTMLRRKFPSRIYTGPIGRVT